MFAEAGLFKTVVSLINESALNFSLMRICMRVHNPFVVRQHKGGARVCTCDCMCACNCECSCVQIHACMHVCVCVCVCLDHFLKLYTFKLCACVCLCKSAFTTLDNDKHGDATCYTHTT